MDKIIEYFNRNINLSKTTVVRRAPTRSNIQNESPSEPRRDARQRQRREEDTQSQDLGNLGDQDLEDQNLGDQDLEDQNLGDQDLEDQNLGDQDLGEREQDIRTGRRSRSKRRSGGSGERRSGGRRSRRSRRGSNVTDIPEVLVTQPVMFETTPPPQIVSLEPTSPIPPVPFIDPSMSLEQNNSITDNIQVSNLMMFLTFSSLMSFISAVLTIVFVVFLVARI